MYLEIIPIPNLRYEKVAFYTVRLEGRNISEFKDFQQKMSLKENDLAELNEIRRYIMLIGSEYGAEKIHFKEERAAQRLPPPYHYIETDSRDDYGLRLYCIRLTKEIVILLNGGRKTNHNPEKCQNCSSHFKMANRIAVKIDEAILKKNIHLNIENKEIEIEEDFELEL